MPISSIMDELEPGLRLQVALASVGRLLHTLPVLKECPQLLQRIALLMEPQVAAEGACGAHARGGEKGRRGLCILPVFEECPQLL